jgi:hypothetical protein
MNWQAWIPRIIGVAAGWGATKLGEASGVVVDPASLTALGLAVYALFHRGTSAAVNPGDAVSTPVIEKDKEVKAQGSI